MSWFATKSSPPARRSAHAAKPLRSPHARIERREDGSAVVQLPLKPGWFIRASSGATRSFELDAVGVLVWDACDGKSDVEQIVGAVAERYRLNLREAEVATLKFLETLARRRLIGVGDETSL